MVPPVWQRPGLHLIAASQNKPDLDNRSLFVDEYFVMPLALQPVYTDARTDLTNIS
jgi:hypothetical protein